MSRQNPGTTYGNRSTKSLSLAALVAILVLTAGVILVCLMVAVATQADLRDVLRSGSAIQAEAIFTRVSGQVVAPGPTAQVVSREQEPVASLSEATPNPLRAKPVVAGLNEPRLTWTATPPPTITPTPSPTPNPTFVSSAYGLGEFMPSGIAPDERWIDVDLSGQKLVAFEGLLPVFDTLVSTGTAAHPTVTGQFRIWLRFRAQDMDGYRLGYDYYLKGVPYVQYFYEDYALHGTFWHSNFGTPMSHGCVNLSPAAAEWLYSWAGYGTLVNIHP